MTTVAKTATAGEMHSLQISGQPLDIRAALPEEWVALLFDADGASARSDWQLAWRRHRCVACGYCMAALAAAWLWLLAARWNSWRRAHTPAAVRTS